MQCLCAPTRAEVDKAHARRSWADIGMQSVHNLRHIKKWKVFLWCILGIASVPMHLVYNSVFYYTRSANAYELIIAHKAYLDRGNATSLGLTDFQDELRANYISRPDKFTKLDNAKCIDEYSRDFNNDHSHLILFTDSCTVQNNEDPGCDGFPVYAQKTIGAEIEGFHSFSWMVNETDQAFDDAKVDQIRRRPSEWSIDDPNHDPNRQSEGYHITGCVGQKVEARCSIQFSYELGVVVVIFNLVKVACMIIALLCIRDKPLMTIGDAVESFMRSPDEVTSGCCFASAVDIQKYWGAGFELPGARKFSPKSERWSRGASGGMWSLWIFTFLLVIVFTAGFMVWGIFGLRQHTSNLFVGIGEVTTSNIIFGWGLPTVGITGPVLIANLPQTLFSFLYLIHNNLCTRIALATEWADFSHERKGLRVSDQVGPDSAQRSTYFLQLPYRWSVPLMALCTTMHWLISQSIYLTVIRYFDESGQLEREKGNATCAYSPTAMVCVLVIAIVVMLTTIMLARTTKFKPGLPVAGSNSVAIAACCHPPDRGDDVKEPLMWGAIPEAAYLRGDQNSGEEERNTIEVIGHCSFSSLRVDMPVSGKRYA